MCELYVKADPILYESRSRSLRICGVVTTLRLENQVELIRSGQKPDNYLTPSELPEFQRNHLRDAFVVVRTMQASLGHGRRVPI